MSANEVVGAGLRRKVKKSKKREVPVKPVITTENQVDSTVRLYTEFCYVTRFIRVAGHRHNIKPHVLDEEAALQYRDHVTPACEFVVYTSRITA